jgi:hypothetical protein
MSDFPTRFSDADKRLRLAIDKDDPDAARLALLDGADIESLDKDGYTPLNRLRARSSEEELNNVVVDQIAVAAICEMLFDFGAESHPDHIAPYEAQELFCDAREHECRDCPFDVKDPYGDFDPALCSHMDFPSLLNDMASQEFYDVWHQKWEQRRSDEELVSMQRSFLRAEREKRELGKILRAGTRIKVKRGP